jgi:hypothetical protein
MLEVVLVDVCRVSKKVGWGYGRSITAGGRWAFGQAKQQASEET